MKKPKHTTRLALAAMFLALGLVLPFITGQVPQIGKMLSPMHIPVLLCGLVCGWQYGAVIGFILPPLRSALFGMPAMFPEASAMAFELAVYGLVIGLLFRLFRRQNVATLYLSLIAAMICGRIVWGIVRLLFTGVSDQVFTWQLFLSGALIRAIPAIIVQLILIPAVMAALDRTGVLPFTEKET